ncbi:MAG: aminoacyl-tRNA hydrolase [Candidatus Tectimicrobiota bacterium]
MHVLVGLGNPGQRYRHTRHNIGFEVIDALAQHYHIAVRQREAEALCGRGLIGTHQVLCAKPQTYMNASGKSVAPLVQRYLGQGELCVVLHDDIDLPLGKIRVKHQGGDAGHLGIRSIIACLGCNTFTRLRLGVGRPPHKEDVVEYVLSPFTAAEEPTCQTMITQAVAWVETLLAAPRQPQ